jgi:hypothetical protein
MRNKAFKINKRQTRLARRLRAVSKSKAIKPTDWIIKPRDEDLAALASKMKLTPSQAMALPAVVERAAQSVGRTPARMISLAMCNEELRGNLAIICERKVDGQD